jgi:hypothetical protein
MPGVRDRIILFPRYTTLAGPGDFTTQPINVAAYSGGDITLWLGGVVTSGGGSISGDFTIEESTDQAVWWACAGGTATLSAGNSTTLSPTFTRAWLRIKFTMAPAGDALAVSTVYATGFIERRRAPPASAQASASTARDRNGRSGASRPTRRR